MVNIEAWTKHCLEKLEIDPTEITSNYYKTLTTCHSSTYTGLISTLSIFAHNFSTHTETSYDIEHAIENDIQYKLIRDAYRLLVYVTDRPYSDMFSKVKKMYSENQNIIRNNYNDINIVEEYMNELTSLVTDPNLNFNYSLDILNTDNIVKLEKHVANSGGGYQIENFENYKAYIDSSSKTKNQIVSMCMAVIKTLTQLDGLGNHGFDSVKYLPSNKDELEEVLASYQTLCIDAFMVCVVISFKFANEEEMKQFSIKSMDEQSNVMSDINKQIDKELNSIDVKDLLKNIIKEDK